MLLGVTPQAAAAAATNSGGLLLSQQASCCTTGGCINLFLPNRQAALQPGGTIRPWALLLGFMECREDGAGLGNGSRGSSSGHAVDIDG